MTGPDPGQAPPEAEAKPSATRFAIPARLHVIVLFMIQFMILITLLGGVAPTLHARGISTVVLVIAAIAVVIAVHLGLGALGRLVPVRCRDCRSRTYFRGFGWWPFIYRYQCSTCGQEMRLEVRG